MGSKLVSKVGTKPKTNIMSNFPNVPLPWENFGSYSYLNRDTHNLVNKLGIFKIQPETPMNFLNEPDEFYDFAKLFIFLIKLAYLSSSLT